MVPCKFCGKETVGASSCLESRVVIAGTHYHPVPFERKTVSRFRKETAPVRCPDCNVVDGGYHHVGCGLEICPKCGYRWVTCRCSGSKIIPEDPEAPQTRKVIPLKPSNLKQ